MALRVLSQSDVSVVLSQLTTEALVTMSGRLLHTISAAEGAGSTPEQGPSTVQVPLRTSLQLNNHKVLVMPSRVVGHRPMSAVKVVGATGPNAPPAIRDAGLPATTLVFDEETARVKAVVNAAQLTAVRSAAGSALATKVFGNPNATKMVIFGSGAQADWHARLICSILPRLDTLVFIVRDPQSSRSRAFLQRMGESVAASSTSKTTIRLNGPSAADDEVRDSDVICTCTPATSPLFSTEALSKDKQVHINAIGSYTRSMHEFDLLPLLKGSTPSLGTVTVDSLSACKAEAGELVSAVDSGSLQWAEVVEIGTLLNDQGSVDAGRLEHAPRRTIGNVTLFKAVGIGAQDATIAEVVVEMAAKLGVGTELAF